MNTQTITIPLQDQTGLNKQAFTIYVLGFSTTSKKMLSVAPGKVVGKFVPVPNDSGTLPAYKLGSQIQQINIDMTTPVDKIDGARIYFFVADNSKFPNAPKISYKNGGASVANVLNPPNLDYPPYSFAEFTVVDLGYGAVIDLQTVDGLTFPLNLTLNDNLGAVGQPLSADSGFNRNTIFAAYKTFMKTIDPMAGPYLDLQYGENSGGLLNPGIFLIDTNSKNELTNLASPLNGVFDSDLATLFSNKNLSLQGVSAGSIKPDIYTITSTGNLPLPTPTGLSHPALQFKGKAFGNKLNVFSPLGICTLAFSKGGTQAAITGQLVDATLTFDTPLPSDTNIVTGMFVSGAGVDPNKTTVISIARDPADKITGLTVSGNLKGKPSPSQYGFSKVPGMFMTSGAMVFANAGTFAYSGDCTPDEATVVLNMQNQIVSALNRGIANTGPGKGPDGYSSAFWGTQTNWYPKGTVQNLFSLFMHTATVSTGKGDLPIFIQAAGSLKCSRGTVMGQAYGFAYDENAGPVPPAPAGQPHVPSKFDPLPPAARELTITLGAWA